MQTGTDPRRILHGRHENNLIHDEVGLRHFYAQWGEWMDRNPSAPNRPFREQTVTAAE